MCVLYSSLPMHQFYGIWLIWDISLVAATMLGDVKDTFLLVEIALRCVGVGYLICPLISGEKSILLLGLQGVGWLQALVCWLVKLPLHRFLEHVILKHFYWGYLRKNLYQATYWFCVKILV
jgi:hypothetical protein